MLSAEKSWPTLLGRSFMPHELLIPPIFCLFVNAKWTIHQMTKCWQWLLCCYISELKIREIEQSGVTVDILEVAVWTSLWTAQDTCSSTHDETVPYISSDFWLQSSMHRQDLCRHTWPGLVSVALLIESVVCVPLIQPYLCTDGHDLTDDRQ